MSFDYDLFVIGAGSGGVRAARVAAGDTGAKVAIAEESRYGGTCVIRGCVPKKLMVFASGYGTMGEEARAYGWDVQIGNFSWPAFREKLEAELDRLEGIYQRLLDNSAVERFAQRATVVDAHTVRLADGTTKTAKHILVATGGRPVRPDVPGAELGMVSDDIFHMAEMPKSVLIVGGGYIGSEFAGVFNGLGVKVTQFYRGLQILRGFDEEARSLIADEMRNAGIDLQTGIDVQRLEADGAGVKVTATDGSVTTFDKVIFATGRKPNTDGMGLEDVGVKLGSKGEVVVDEYSQTAVPSIYAIGDVTDRVQLTPVAIREGMAFVETVFKGNPTKPDHDLIPTAIFTQPEMGTVGLSEEDARVKEPIEVYATSFKPMQQSFAGGAAQKILMKLIVSKATRTVLGCHIVGPSAGEMIQMAGIAVKMGATKEDFDRTVAVHPTAAEEIVTMRTPVRTT
ncbi:glutathione-disulfide reductase [Pseudooceanicola sediminis]|uniref:Glutathione reductase n=1 Tax=Pseudooceanicola sediminis TaxID=2211117 RepID=A0A399IV08_9RHOB|nr:glutathione-disulfide reductase [Pseudooceanicola sediminis]KAA2311475.1 glutathione-disulfide reductase [Puniceibacterium sp. HSS470]RII36891.1 glutathione-disulfide reductase [Pseudooceanicola sediminis]|tara:strand:+ start:4518 stop:5879 length:1362 start_codon:yes stop_codon:yes gene_type:complete